MTGRPAPGIRSWITAPVKGSWADRLAPLLIVFLSLAAGAYLVWGGTTVGKDSITQFYPWYSFLGESLRAGELPGWNPAQFSGAPFAADPLSGWTYLPAMVLFTVLPISAAAGAYLVFHLLLAGLSTYALARVLHINVPGALLAALAYEFNGYFYLRSICCFAYPSVSGWLPLTILGAEMAVRTRAWSGRWMWWTVSGLALSQILASWLGQGSYYALLTLGGYVAYRTVLFPPEGAEVAPSARVLGGRVINLALHGGAILLFGFCLAAAGVLPRLEYHALSNLAEGYASLEGASATYGGWTTSTWRKLLGPGIIYAGLPVLALALAAPVLARARHAVPFFAALCIAALILSGQGPTPLHWALYQLPGFEWIHPHGPERVKVVLYLGIALLAGATLSAVMSRGRDLGRSIYLPALTSAVLLFFGADLLVQRGAISLILILVLALANLCVLACAWRPDWGGLIATMLALLVAVDLLAAAVYVIRDRAEIDNSSRIVRIDLGEYYEPSGAASFLRARTEEVPVRYFGYGPAALNDPKPHYSRWFDDPPTAALMAVNDATVHGLQGIQGYNAIHIDRYDAFMKAVNGTSQNYHDADVFSGGLESPLLELLGVRYMVVPTFTDPSQGELRSLKRTYPIVYNDDTVQILENEESLPRAWITHDAWTVDAELALTLLRLEIVDPRRTTLLEAKPPRLAEPENPSSDQALITEYAANRIRIETYTQEPGLLTMSEVYYPAWKAYVDGRPVRLYRADHLLSAVAVPAGRHTVELRYESRTLQVGTAVSVLTALTLVGGTLLLRGSSHREPR